MTPTSSNVNLIMYSNCIEQVRVVKYKSTPDFELHCINCINRFLIFCRISKIEEGIDIADKPQVIYIVKN